VTEAGDGSWDRLIAGIRDGDRDALVEFYRRYGQALEAIAARNIAQGMRRRVSPESVAQSVCKTFLRRAREQDYSLRDGDSLWRLLCAITLTKVRERVRFHGRQKRGVDRERSLDDVPAAATARGPGPEEAAIFREQLEQVLSSFDEEERRILELRLEECRQPDIAAAVGCSERTVRRILARIEARLRDAFS